MKSQLLKLSTGLVVVFCLMSINNTSAQVDKGKNVSPPQDSPVNNNTPSGYKTKLDCIKVRATTTGREEVSQAYKITIDYGKGKVQTINRTIKVDARNPSVLDCKCYPNSENLTITYAKHAKISRVNMVGSASCN